MIVQPYMYTRANFNTFVATSCLLKLLRRDGFVEYQEAVYSLVQIFKKAVAYPTDDFEVECECSIEFNHAINLLFLLGAVEEGKEQHTYIYIGDRNDRNDR